MTITGSTKADGAGQRPGGDGVVAGHDLHGDAQAAELVQRGPDIALRRILKPNQPGEGHGPLVARLTCVVPGMGR